MLKKEEQLVMEHLWLTKCIAKEYNRITKNSLTYEELISIATLGLVKAATTYCGDKGANFATYSDKCIRNEIRMSMRREYKHNQVLSLDEPIGFDEKERILLKDTIADLSCDFIAEMEEKQEEADKMKEIIDFALNEMKGKKRLAVLYCMAGKNQEWVGEKLEISQSYVSRIYKRFINNFRLAKNKDEFGKEFSIEITSEEYQIAFLAKENPNIIDDIPNFRVTYENGIISIYIPAEIEYISVVADIIQKIK